MKAPMRRLLGSLFVLTGIAGIVFSIIFNIWMAIGCCQELPYIGQKILYCVACVVLAFVMSISCCHLCFVGHGIIEGHYEHD